MSNDNSGNNNNIQNNQPGGNKQRIPQNRNPNQQHHSNRIYTRYSDQRPQYRKHPAHQSNNSSQRTGNSSNDLTRQQQLQQQHQRQRLASSKSSSIGDASKMCICCWHELRTYVYYTCMHYVCLNCSLKMRVLCEKIDCPVCRQESKRVLCTKTQLAELTATDSSDDTASASAVAATASSGAVVEKIIDKLGDQNCLKEPAGAVAAGIFYDSDEIRHECRELMAYRCNLCSSHNNETSVDFKSMDDLDKHMRKMHHRFYCELCLENLKLFPFERKHYDREGLAQHKRVGDKDDFSFKGHPLCEYCDQRFFDRDMLYRHYRKEHYYCHFCDTDGIEEYYRDYGQLRQHFLKCHYLCELDGCSANAAQTHEYVVFRTELDLQAHKKLKHAKSKSDARALGKLNIEFTMSNSARDRQQQNRRRGPPGAASSATTSSTDFDEFNTYRGSDMRAAQSSRLEAVDVDVNSTHRASREQLDDVAERTRQRRLEAMREQHRKYEESMQQKQNQQQQQQQPTTLNVDEEEKTTNISSSSSTPAPTITTTNTEVAVSEPAASFASSHWRNVIGCGNVPKINKETEFPSLSAESGSSSKLMSLAELGASIGASSSSSSLKSAWTSKSASAAAKNTPQKSSSKKVHSPPRFTIGDDDGGGGGGGGVQAQEEAEKKSGKKKKKQQQQQQQQQPKTNEANNKQESTPKTTSEDVEESLKKKPPPTTITTQSNASISSAPPPGFESKPQLQPPPMVSGPPPGFAVSAKSMPPIAETFIKPVEYDMRNQELKAKLMDLFDKKAFNEFMALSIEFRNSLITADDYLDKCEGLLDFSQPGNNQLLIFLDLVQEMIVLLPNADKQSQLYAVFDKLIRKPASSLAWTSSSVSATSRHHHQETSATKIANRLAQCDVCEQYFTRDEIEAHKTLNHESTTSKDGAGLSWAASSSSSAAASNSKENSRNIVDFPELTSSFANKINLTPVAVSAVSAKKSESATEEFPPLDGGGLLPNTENRFSSMPSSALFSNPSSHLSLANKKKHRLFK